jgi:hypothetical protein
MNFRSKQNFNYYGIFRYIKAGSRLPRKIKKCVLGYRMSKTQIKKHYNNSVLFVHQYQSSTSLSVDVICPECGCYWTITENHGAEYPEVYITEYCARCHCLIGSADNSPTYLFYECDDNEFVNKHKIRTIFMINRERYEGKLKEKERSMNKNNTDFCDFF